MRIRKGISPLVASTILVIIAIAGGIMLYQYYNTLMTSLTSSAETLIVKKARLITLDNKSMLYIDLWNPSSYTATISNVIIDNNEIKVNETIKPASSKQIMITINNTSLNIEPGTSHYIVLKYKLNNNELYTDPFRVIAE